VLLGTFVGQVGTSWEHMGKLMRTKEKAKKFLPLYFPERKKLDPS
jgi:hypothetical protein